MDELDGAACVECGRYFPPDELVRLNNSPICAACKPIYLQKLAEGAALPSDGLWRRKGRLIMARGADLPDRCIKCNAPAKGFRVRGSMLYFTGTPPNRIVWMAGLCEQHRKRRHRGWRIFWSGAGLALLFVIGAIALGGEWLILLSILSFFGVGLVGAVLTSTLRVEKVTRENVWLLGCGNEFLDSLPDWPGA